jgi:isopenicillin-N N-acyltransferase-like protein
MEEDLTLNGKNLQFTALKGAISSCGEDYGEIFSEYMQEFLDLEISPDTRRKSYARNCINEIKKSAPNSMQFIKGMARGSGLQLEDVVLLSLHEEIVHQCHCTALLASGPATKDGNTIVGQNWDWEVKLSKYAGLLDLSIKNQPRVLSYHYPGLWTSAGINEHGLALMWTGGGYFPMVRPKVGVPTYAIISELFRFNNTSSAINYLKKINNAGSFIFFLGDDKGHSAIIEAVPGKIEVEEGKNIYTRANHYNLRRIIAASRQKVHKDESTIERQKRINQLAQLYNGSMTANSMKNILEDPILYHTDNRYPVTLDSLMAICKERILIVRRGHPKPSNWKTYYL